jgi:hypothetical protein
MVRIHGNYCGPNWTGGKAYAAADKRVDWNVPCVDRLDCACKNHDRDCAHPQGCSSKSDRILVRQAARVRTFSRDKVLRAKAEAIIIAITTASYTRSR